LEELPPKGLRKFPLSEFVDMVFCSRGTAEGLEDTGFEVREALLPVQDLGVGKRADRIAEDGDLGARSPAKSRGWNELRDANGKRQPGKSSKEGVGEVGPSRHLGLILASQPIRKSTGHLVVAVGAPVEAKKKAEL
jgi:hypothetical protein